MIERETAIINQFSTDRAEVVAASRFFNNDSVELGSLIEATRAACAAQCAGRRVLAIQDTTEVNYSSHEGLLKASDPEIGPVGNDRDAGFFLHPTLALDADTGLALGFADVQVHSRRWDKQDKHERDYQNQPIEAKESYRWIASSRQAKTTLTETDRVTIIADREGDIYHLLATGPDEHTDVLVRARSDRRLAEAMQAEAMQAEAMQAEAMQAEAMQAEAMQAEAMQAEAMQAEAMQAEAHASRSDASRSDASRSDASRSDASRSDASRSDASRSDASRSDASRSDASRSDASRSDASTNVCARYVCTYAACLH